MSESNSEMSESKRQRENPFDEYADNVESAERIAKHVGLGVFPVGDENEYSSASSDVEWGRPRPFRIEICYLSKLRALETPVERALEREQPLEQRLPRRGVGEERLGRVHAGRSRAVEERQREQRAIVGQGAAAHLLGGAARARIGAGLRACGWWLV